MRFVCFVLHLQAGITTGYQEKPCLDPSDPECPASAPNKRSGMVSILVYVHQNQPNFKYIT